jgi:hypothetical protein
MFRREVIERKTNHPVEHLRIENMLILTIGSHTDPRVLLDRNRQHIPIVVIGVLAHQVYTAWSFRHHDGSVSKHFLKAAHQPPLSLSRSGTFTCQSLRRWHRFGKRSFEQNLDLLEFARFFFRQRIHSEKTGRNFRAGKIFKPVTRAVRRIKLGVQM